MKILWLCNIPIPKAAEVFKLKSSPIEGWLVSVAQKLSEDKSIQFIYSFGQNKKPYGVYCAEQEEGTTYISINEGNVVSDLSIETYRKLFSEIKPDIIHIWGSEYAHCYSAVKGAEKSGDLSKVVISIQGLVGMYKDHYMSNLPGTVQIFPTLRDVLRGDTLCNQKKRFEILGNYEKKAIKLCKHVIGRTFWDKACVKLINPDIEYHFNNETLRPAFYKNLWSYENCIRHSIFVSQAQYPIKGFHNVLEAVNMLRECYPDIKVYVSGNNNSFKKGYRRTAYGKYIQKLIKRYSLSNVVMYVGMLKEEEMVQQYLKSEIFVSPSSIENSPNSVGEAMLLGIPVISSNVGGVSDLLVHGEEGYLYQSDAPYLLAYYISCLFENQSLEKEFGKKAHEHAMITHSIEENYFALQEIYKTIFIEANKK